METLRIDILNPKAKKLLKDLADLELIKIRKQPATDFSTIVEKLRSKSVNAPSLDDITLEVEAARSKRYDK